MNTNPPNPAAEALAEDLDLELKRHKLGGRERLIAQWLVAISYGWGADSVAFPTLEVLGRLAGLPRPHVHAVLESLTNMRIVKVDMFKGGIRVTVNPDPESWKVQPVVARETVRETLELIREFSRPID